MNRPPLKTMALGHPIPAFAICSVASLLLYEWLLLQTVEAGVFGLAGAAIASQALKANDRRRRYLQWQRQWAAMAGEQPVRRHWTALKGLTIGTVLAVLAIAALQSDHADLIIVGTLGLLTVVAMATGLLIGVGKLIRLVRPKRRSKPRPVVQVVVTRPVLPVPRLDRAYAALPPYCHTLLRRQAINS